MENIQKTPENNVEMEDGEPNNEIDSSIDTHFMKLEEILRNKENRDSILKQASENLDMYRQILIDQTQNLKEIRDKNQELSFKITYENQWRDKVIKRMIQTHDKLKIVTSSTNQVKNIITFCETNLEQIRQGKRQLTEQIAFYKEKHDLKYDQLIQEDNLLTKKIEKQKFILNNAEKQYENDINEINNQITTKKQSINDLKIKINNLRLENQIIEMKNNNAVSKNDLISKEIDIINLKREVLDENVVKDTKIFNEKITNINNLIEINDNRINDLNKKINTILEDINDEKVIIENLNLNKNEIKEKISQSDIELNSLNEENNKIVETYNLQTEEYKLKFLRIKQEIQEKLEEINGKEKENLKQKNDNHLLVNEIMSQESKNNQLDIELKTLKDEFQEQQFSLNENENNFQTTIQKLKEQLEDKSVKKNIEEEIEVLENQIEGLNMERENEEINYENIREEVATKQLNLDLQIDKLKEEKRALQTAVEEVKNKIREEVEKMDDEIRRVEEENNSKIKKLEGQTDIYKKENEKVRETNEEKRKLEFEELKKINSDLKKKINECQLKKQNLDIEIGVRGKELERIRETKEKEKKERQEKEFLEAAAQAADREMLVDVPEIEGIEKKSINGNDNKKMKMTKPPLPNLKIPESKYSSTSFDDSSVCSLDTSPLQRKFMQQKRQTLPTKLYQDTQKSLDEIFSSLREETQTTVETTTIKKPKTKKTRKTVF